MERRRYRREPIDVEVDYGCEGTFLFTYTMDVSSGGIFIHAHNPHPPGTRLALRLRLPGETEPTVLRGEVIRTIPSPSGGTIPPDSVEEAPTRPGMGVRFLDADPDVLARLMALVERDA